MNAYFSNKILDEVIKVSSDIWRKGWAEGNGGNITVLLTPATAEEFLEERPRTDWMETGGIYPELAEELFVVSGSGKFLRNIELKPERNIGVIQLDHNGSKYRVLWGLEGNTNPTSELKAHLGVHAVRRRIGNDKESAVIHTHAPNLIALTLAEDLSTKKLTRLIWEMHAECVVVFQDGVGLLPFDIPGTESISDATAALFLKHRIILWQFHGAVAVGRNLDSAFGLIDTAEKTAKIYLTAKSAGGIKNKLTKEQILSVAKTFKANPDMSYFD